jgi:hypothetical protein
MLRIVRYLSYTDFKNVSHVTLPRWSSTDSQQMAGDVTMLDVGVNTEHHQIAGVARSFAKAQMRYNGHN